MTDYVETFVANGKTYGIEKTEDGHALWAGGCVINRVDCPTMESARKLLHGYIVSQLQADIGSAQRLIERASSDLFRIEGDPFYLGRIMRA